LISLLFAGVFLLWHHVYAAAIVTALLNALGAAWLYLAGRMFTDRRAAAIAAILLGCAPFFVGVFPDGDGFAVNHGGHSLLTDAPALSLIVLAFWLLLRALARQTSLRFGFAGFALALSVLMRFGSLSSVGVLGLLVLAAHRRIKATLACAIGFFVGFGPYLCWSRWRYGGFLTTLQNGWTNFEGPRKSPFFYLKLYGDIFTWISLAGIVLWFMQWAWEMKNKNSTMLPNELAAARYSRRMQGFLSLWLVVVLVFFSSLRHSEPRYIMPVAPPLFLLAGIGLSVLLKGRTPATRWGGAALLAAAMIYTFLPLRERLRGNFIDDSVSEEMTVSAFLNRSVPAGTVLHTNMNYPDFGYYTNLPIEPLPESGPKLYKDLGQLSNGDLLIAYKILDDGTTPEPSMSWIDSNPSFQRLKEFPSLILYKYQTPSVIPSEK
jgi:4-amino-4-deoxy-L-arabinose transferase-like glycosyltransferase